MTLTPADMFALNAQSYELVDLVRHLSEKTPAENALASKIKLIPKLLGCMDVLMKRPVLARFLKHPSTIFIVNIAASLLAMNCRAANTPLFSGDGGSPIPPPPAVCKAAGAP